jgi:PAS domain S-box-containing protein
MAQPSDTLPPKTRPERDTLWASALSAAAAVARRGVYPEADIPRAVTEELRRLRLVGALMLLTPEGTLRLENRPFSPTLETTLRRLTGVDLKGYQFDPNQVDLYREALASGEAAFSARRSEVIAQMLPPHLQRLLPRLIHLIGERPLIVAPVTFAGQPMGALSASAGWLTAEDASMVAALADHIAIALGQSRVRAETQAALERERLRNQVAETIASNLDLPQVLERVLHLAADVTGADAGVLALLSTDRETLAYGYVFGLPEEGRDQSVPRGQGITWQAIEARESILAPNYRQTPYAYPAWVQAGVRAALAVPLIVGEETIGALGLYSLQREAAFNQEHAEMVQAMGRMAAVAITNSRSFAEAQRRSEESRALIRSAGAISASLDLHTVLTEICEQAKALLRADGSRVHLLNLDSGQLECVVAVQPDAEQVKAVKLIPGQGLTGHVLQMGEPLIINQADPRSVHVPGTPLDDPEVLAMAPLKVRQRSMGVMTVLRFSYERPFTPADLDLLTAFASHAAVALENAHLYGQIEKQAQRLEAEVVERTRDLALSEARYRSLVETSLAGIYQADAQGKLVYANRAFAAMLERRPEDLIGQDGTTLGIAQPAEAEARNHAARMRGERADREVSELEFVSGSGKRIPTLRATSVIRDSDGKAQGITGLVIDISERKVLEAALQAERDRLHAILNNIGDAVMVTDAEARIEYVNPAWERLNGFLATEALGSRLSLIGSGETPREMTAKMRAAIHEGKIWRGETVNRRKDGTIYDAAVTVAPIHDETGSIVNLVGVQHDISALKEIDRMKTQFVSDVSHELRTPLTNIRLYLDLISSSGDSTKTNRYLETMDRETTRLGTLIDDLLSLSRLEAGTVAFNPTPTDINRLLQALVDDRSALAASRGLQLALECDPQLPPIVGDERLLTQVFTNLLTNSLNYTPEGGKVTLRSRRCTSNGSEWVTTEVEDSGLGIPTDEQSMIFRRFYRGRASREATAPGTGLGLAICKEILDRHAGRIEVESDGVPGRGARFTVWLPLPPT